jgi:hypothetical protein
MDMLRHAAAAVAASGVDKSLVTLVHGDLMTFSGGGAFDLVVVGGLTLSLFEPDEARRRLFAAIGGHLKPGGAVALDYIPASTAGAEATSVTPVNIDGNPGFLLIGCRRDPETRVQLANFLLETVTSDGVTRRVFSYTRSVMLTPEELHAAATEAGLVVANSPMMLADRFAAQSRPATLLAFNERMPR